MSDWKQKRFWKDATVSETPDGFSVLLDGRGVKTPAKATLAVPSQRMAQAIAQEWQAQEDVVNPNTMPFTRSANAAIDKVRHQHGEVADMLAEYGDSDLLCYRATHPQELIDRQAAAWDPLLDWAAETLGARLVPFSGVMHSAQAADAIAHLRAQTHALDAFEMTAFHDLVSLSGSLVMGFAALHDAREAAGLWEISRLDELWQEEQWGPDDEAQAAAAVKKQAFLHAKDFVNAHRAG